MPTGAINPWVALDVATDPVAHSTLLRRAHERAIESGRTPDEVRSVVAESWRRSMAAGIEPDGPRAPVLLEADELEAARERSPLAVVLPAIQSALGSLDSVARHVVAIADADATLLWVTGDPGALELAREMRFQEGAAWAESTAGTNAVGTAAALDHPVQIFSAEHLVTAVHPWTCSGAPIHDPETGELLGVVDLTAELRTAHPHTLSLAELAARAAESTLRVAALERAARLREQWEAETFGRRCSSALVDGRGRVIASGGRAQLPARVELPDDLGDGVVLPDGRVCEAQALEGGAILWLTRRRAAPAPRLKLSLLGHGAQATVRGAGRHERGLRSLELLAVLAMHPGGMTAEQLALALYGEEGKAVTVRAQVHRVRAHLAEDLISTQPYRLEGGVEADWVAVRRLVADGRPARALRAYTGPLLPGSDAPAISEARALLEESLRRSILTTAEPDLLERWLDHPAGVDDLAAARALVAVLPAGDPRRAAATSTLTAVSRRMAPAADATRVQRPRP